MTIESIAQALGHIKDPVTYQAEIGAHSLDALTAIINTIPPEKRTSEPVLDVITAHLSITQLRFDLLLQILDAGSVESNRFQATMDTGHEAILAAFNKASSEGKKLSGVPLLWSSILSQNEHYGNAIVALMEIYKGIFDHYYHMHTQGVYYTSVIVGAALEALLLDVYDKQLGGNSPESADKSKWAYDFLNTHFKITIDLAKVNTNARDALGVLIESNAPKSVAVH